MEESTVSLRQLAASSKHFERRRLTSGENRLERLTVEGQEERERLLHAFLLALGGAAFGLLAGITLTATIVVLLWACLPVAVLVTLTGLDGVGGVYPCQRLTGVRRDWRPLPLRSINPERTAHVWKKPPNESWQPTP